MSITWSAQRAQTTVSKKEIKKNNFCSQVLEFCYFSGVIAVKSTCVEELVEGIMNGDFIMGNEIV